MKYTVHFLVIVMLVFSVKSAFSENMEIVNRAISWKQIKCNPLYQEFTIGQLKSMVKSNSFSDSRKVIGGGIENNNATINDATVIRILNQVPDDLTKIVGVYSGVNGYNWPLGSILSKTLLQAIRETGATDFVVYWDQAWDDVIDKGIFATYYRKERVDFVKIVAFRYVGPQSSTCKGEYNLIP